MKIRPVSQAMAREWFDYYDTGMGFLVWKKEPAIMARNKGKIAGTYRNGYTYVSIEGTQYGAHRLIYAYMKGDIPEGVEIDHIDGDRGNNRINNLRVASSSQQKMNKGVQSNNRSGLKGAYYHACRKGKKWRSQIKVGERLIFLGYHDTAKGAHEAYVKAASQHFGEFARIG